jgi:monoamine oxidase
MGRTPLFSALQRLAAEHSAADAAGLPVAEYRGIASARRLDGGREPALSANRAGSLDRRTALKLGITAAATAAGALSVARPAAAGKVQPSTGTPPRVAVIGGGMAGMAAALALTDAGIPCTVYEASQRIGGRMYSETSYWANGQVSEYGGELIDTGHKDILHLVQRFGLSVVDVNGSAPNGSDQIFWFNNGYYSRAQLDQDFKAVNNAVQKDLHAALPEATYASATPGAIALDNMTLYDWIESRVPGGHTSPLGRLLDVAYNIEYGLDCQEQSALALVYLLGYNRNPGHVKIWGLSDERYHIVGGNQQLPQAIAASLPAGTIQLGHQLIAVKANTNGTQTLTFSVGGTTKTVTADHTVLTVPLGVLQRLDLTKAAFDPLARGVLANMRMGYCTKLNMQFNSRPWLGTGPWPGISSGETFTDENWQQMWDVTAGQAGSSGIIVQYGGGSLAGSLKPPAPFTTSAISYTAKLSGTMQTGIQHAFPGLKAAWNGRSTLSAWHLNPLAYGAYSGWPVGYVSTYAGYEGVAQGNIHIGGEHCSYDYQGYMQGAAVEGARAAAEIIALI